VSDQPLDLRRSMQVIRRHWIAVGLVTLVGLGAGAGYTELKPPMQSSYVLVQLSTATSAAMATQVVIASSDPVLEGALPHISRPPSLLKLHTLVTVSSLSTSIMSITASGKTAAAAEQTAAAVGNSYVRYLRDNSQGPSGSAKLTAKVLGGPPAATGPSLISAMILTASIGGLIGLLVGAIGALAFTRNDRRLRQRDEIADAIGVPVLASLPVVRATDAAHWSKLLDDYQPSVADAWRLRNALQYLGLFDTRYPQARHHGGQSVAVLSLSTDKRALALGPQLASFAASLGITTVLVVGRHEDASVAATLRVACTAQPPKRSGNLRLMVADHDEPYRQSDAMLTIVVAVVDGHNPSVADAIPTSVTVLSVTAGTATADQLARVATSAAAHGSNIDGILIADPDPTDPTTGRIPQLVRPARNGQPTRIAGLTTETRR
jgi:capsular polysaccharide biosynthesis protein